MAVKPAIKSVIATAHSKICDAILNFVLYIKVNIVRIFNIIMAGVIAKCIAASAINCAGDVLNPHDNSQKKNGSSCGCS